MDDCYVLQDVCTDNQDNTRLITFIDSDTLQITGTKLLDFAINAIAYSPDYNQYAAGIKGSSASFAILDENFAELAYVDGHSFGLSPQDVDCDANYGLFRYGDRQGL